MIAALLGVLAVLVLTLGTALFVASEFSLVAVERTQLENAVKAGDPRAISVQKSVRTLSFQLSGCQLGITITTLVVGFIAEPSFARLIEPGTDAIGLSDSAASVVSYALAITIATVLQMVVGELIPKNWAIARPMQVARTVAGPQRLASNLVKPLIAVCNGTANRLVRSLGIEPQEELRSARSAEELGSLVRTSGETGSLSPQTATMLARSLAFGDRSAADVMTSRTQVLALPETASVSQLLTAARESGHSRFPVEGDGIDDLVGVVHVKQALAVPRAERRRTRLATVMGPLPRVPESLHLDSLLVQLREPGLQMAVVVDEYGGTAGIVTLEDLVEELVGEVDDEHDADSRPPIEKRRGNTVLSGLLRDDEVQEALGLQMPEGPYDTLGGFIMARLGRLPKKGDLVEHEGWVLKVTELDGRRVDRVSVETEPVRVEVDA